MSDKSPTRQQWQEAYELADVIGKLQPWQHFLEDTYFCFANPFTEEQAFISLMGNRGEHLAVAVYPDSTSLYQIEDIAAGEFTDGMELFFVPHLQLSFENRDLVKKEDRAIMKQLDRKYRGKHAWPIFRSYAAGFAPWFVTGNELSLLGTALRLIGEKVPRYLEQSSPNNFRFSESGVVLMLDGDSADTLQTIKRPAERLIDPKIDPSELTGIMDWQTVTNAIEVELTFPPAPVTDRERPYYPGLLMAVTEKEGFVVGFGMIPPDPDYDSILANLPSAFIEAFREHKVMPNKVLVRNRQVFHSLESLATTFGFELCLRRRLPAARKVVDSMRGGMPFMG